MTTARPSRLHVLRAILLGLAIAITPMAAYAQYVGGTIFGGSSGGGGGSMSAAAILAALLTVDGTGSLLDADLLDGNSSAAYLTTTMTGASVTCSDNGAGTAQTINLDVSCAIAGNRVVVPLINSDANGCTITMQETSATLGCIANIHVVSTAGGTITLADVSNVADVNGSWTPTAAGENLVLSYQDMANDQWIEINRSGGISRVSGALTTSLGLTVGSLTSDGVTVNSNNFINLGAGNLTLTVSGGASTTVVGSTFTRVQAAEVTTWSPATAGLSGRLVYACNVGSFAITMLDSTTYEGSGCVLGANDCVGFIHDTTTAKYRELFCNTGN